MKKKNSIQLTAIFLAGAMLCLLVPVYAESSAPLSPALEQLAAEMTMVKSGYTGDEITFACADFEKALGISELSSITVTELPPEKDGVLMIGSIELKENQRVSAENIPHMRFVPASASEVNTGFVFYPGEQYGNYSVECILRSTDIMNLAPTAAGLGGNAEVSTYCDISYFGTLTGADPEQDLLFFEISDYPKKGIVKITDTGYGNFKYTPYAGAVGNDHFSYTVRDEYGNYSDECKVNIRIEKNRTELVFADMEDHWGYNAAITVANLGLMQGYISGTESVFKPQETVSRVDFLVMLMDTLGADHIPVVSDTGFADDAAIPSSAKGYVAAAAKLGIIRGDETDTGVYFYPNKSVTRCEAAVMINNILGVEEPAVIPVFADNDSIPVWAKSAMYALNKIGVFKGTGSGYITPYSTLTRAQTAQILASLMNLNG